LAEETQTFLLADCDGIRVHYPKSVLHDNKQWVRGKSLELSRSAYDHYFIKRRKSLEKTAADKLKDNFTDVMRHKRLVLNNGKYFLIRTPWLSSGGAHIGGVYYCLGALLESWKKEKYLVIKTEEGDTVYMIRIAGSPLSGAINGEGWSVREQRIVPVGKLQPGLLEWINRFKKISERYDQKMRVNFTSINELLRETALFAQ
ncbi:MAG: hypothetical protein RIQ47_1248, partial [Bacteroidota bacterium]